ncbi:hypothetical protein [Candidatus Spongiihabitans sp.]|uniref:hypothetical protein n=1 Tax=Candidatus Spongiihabitans sp. TaxID=3101308 RepID=UPI003C6ECA76
MYGNDINEMLCLMDKAFRDFEKGMPNKPELLELSFGKAYRFTKKDIREAMIQKLARVQSLVRGAQLLFRNGFAQEQGILQRAIDETNEDILFLVDAVTNGTITKLHQEFLDYFWEEEIDESGNLIESQQKRPMTPRRKIRAYLAKMGSVEPDKIPIADITRSLSRFYSGFVHGGSPHIMDMYVGDPPYFHTNGMLDTSRISDYAFDLWCCTFRSYCSHISVGKAVGAEIHVKILTKHKQRFEQNMPQRLKIRSGTPQAESERA